MTTPEPTPAPAPEPVDDRLGRLLSTHPVAVGRYLSTGVTALGLAAGGGLVMVRLMADPGMAAGRLLALALLPLVGLPIAVVQLTRLRRSGRNGVYQLYENGLAHRAAGRTRSWTWQQVAVLRAGPDALDSQPAVVPVERLVRRLGWHFRCAVRFTDGATIRIDGYTADGPVIARALLTHCSDAVPARSARRGPRTLLATLPVAVAAFASGTVLLYRHMNSTAADDIVGGELVALALGMIVCLVGLVLSLTVFIMVLVALMRTRPDDGSPRSSGQ